MNNLPAKAYLGDGVFAYWDGAKVILSTEDGTSVESRMVLEPEVLLNLDTYVQFAKAAAGLTDPNNQTAQELKAERRRREDFRREYSIAPWAYDDERTEK